MKIGVQVIPLHSSGVSWLPLSLCVIQICLSCLIMSGVKKKSKRRKIIKNKRRQKHLPSLKCNISQWSLECVSFQTALPNRATGALTQLLFYLVSKHVCQSTKSQYKDELSGDTSLPSFPVSNQRKQTVSSYKDDSVLSECTSEGPLQGDRERNTSFLQVFLPLIKWMNKSIIPLLKYDSLRCFYCCVYFSRQ